MADDLTDRAVPDDWAEVSDPDEIAEKYDPRVPTLFEYAGREIAVHILPDEPNTPHADSTRWRLGFVRGSQDNLKGATPIVHVHGRENASHAAHVFIEIARRIPRPLRSGRKPTTDDTDYATIARPTLPTSG